MEITNEIKAKVFAQYLGQNIMSEDGETYELCMVSYDSLIGYEKPFLLSEGDEVEIAIKSWCKLILKPLSSITDEDAVEATKLLGHKVHSLEGIKKILKFHLESAPEHYFSHVSTYICQYLQSKGYDLPQYLLGGKTLFEAGLAIYE